MSFKTDLSETLPGAGSAADQQLCPATGITEARDYGRSSPGLPSPSSHCGWISCATGAKKMAPQIGASSC